ncbi:MAG: ald 1, partial [Gammaproteobacteria bacterium]|nr:ald 1 [Gammaproteobacteria bacterium]
MLIGVPKEIKNHEYRVGLTPGSVSELVRHGHQVMVETNAGAGIGFSDQDYINAGATIIPTAVEIFKSADMIVKVKEPQPNECEMLRAGQILFTYLHLAPDPKQTDALIKSGCIAIAYETVTDKFNRLPLLAPMSEVAGLVIGGGVVGTNAIKMAVGMGARVTVLDQSITRLKELDDLFGSALTTVYSTQ